MIDRFTYINTHVPHDEPVFILRAQDMIAPNLIDDWAWIAQLHGAPKEKVDEARAIATAMRAWPNRKYPD